MASSSSSQFRIPSETLNLSASTFTSAIDSWIPAGWGVKQTERDRAAEFDKALRAASLEGESDKLGVGHPDIGKPKQRGPSLSLLGKRLGKVDKKAAVNGNDTTLALAKESENEDDEDSRARSVGSSKRRSALPDFLGGKKKGKAKASVSNPPLSLPPLLNLHPTALVTPDGADESTPRTPHTGATPSPGGSGVFPFAGPVALDSPQAKRVLDDKLTRKRLREDDDSIDSPSISAVESASIQDSEDKDASQVLDAGKLSKSQKRREHRKMAKLAAQNGL